MAASVSFNGMLEAYFQIIEFIIIVKFEIYYSLVSRHCEVTYLHVFFVS